MSNVIPTPKQHAALTGLVKAAPHEGVSEWLPPVESLVESSGALTSIGFWAEEKDLIEIAVVRKTGKRMLRLTDAGRTVYEMTSRRFELGNGRDALLLAVGEEWVAGTVVAGSSPAKSYVAAQPKLDNLSEAIERLLGLVR